MTVVSISSCSLLSILTKNKICIHFPTKGLKLPLNQLLNHLSFYISTAPAYCFYVKIKTAFFAQNGALRTSLLVVDVDNKTSDDDFTHFVAIVSNIETNWKQLISPLEEAAALMPATFLVKLYSTIFYFRCQRNPIINYRVCEFDKLGFWLSPMSAERLHQWPVEMVLPKGMDWVELVTQQDRSSGSIPRMSGRTSFGGSTSRPR